MTAPSSASRTFARSFPPIALSIAVLSLAGCGGGGSGGGTPTFVTPQSDVSVAVGASIAVKATGFVPGALVALTLDADGSSSTTDDQITLGGPLIASASGVIDALVSTDNAPPKAYSLFATSEASSTSLVARGSVTLVPAGLVKLLEGAQGQAFDRVAVLTNGRIAVSGQVMGSITYPTAIGPATFDDPNADDALMAMLAPDGGLYAAWALKGPGYEKPYDLVAGSSGDLTISGAHQGLTSITGPVPGPAQPSMSSQGEVYGGYAATYGADGALVATTTSYSAAPGDDEAKDSWISAVAVGTDGTRWLALHGEEYVIFAETDMYDLGAGGLQLVATDALGLPVGGFLAASGLCDASGLAVLGNGDLLVAGGCIGTVTFAPGNAGERTIDRADWSMFVARFHTDGSLAEFMDLPETGGSSIYRLSALPDGRCYVCGEIYGMTKFGPGATIDPTGHWSDGFVCALDATLVPTWACALRASGKPGFEASASAFCTSVVALADGGCVVAGQTEYEALFDDHSFGSGTGDEYDCGLARFSADGGTIWEFTASGPSHQRFRDLAVDASGAIVVVGSTSGAMLIRDRDNVPTSIFPANPGAEAALLLRVDPDGRLR